MTLDPHTIMQELPHYRERYEAAKKVNVYFLPAHDEVANKPAFFYVLASASLHHEMLRALEEGHVPDFAVVIESGYGEPCHDTKAKIKTMYGFDHDMLANNDNAKLQNLKTAVN